MAQYSKNHMNVNFCDKKFRDLCVWCAALAAHIARHIAMPTI